MAKALKAQSAGLVALESALGYTFARPELLIHALTHRSQSFEAGLETSAPPQTHSHMPDERPDNERLEFLGDAILGLVVAECLYESHPNLQEGELTRLRAPLVSRKHMAEVAMAIHLGDFLLLGKGEEKSGGRRKPAILANAMEAVIAAIYLDAKACTKVGTKVPCVESLPGKSREDAMEPVRRFAREYILGQGAVLLAEELRSGEALGDHKSALQELLQATRRGTPIYRVESESGPDHRKRFQVALCLKDSNGTLADPIASGSGTTKKKAEQEAARIALEKLSSEADRSHSNSRPEVIHRQKGKTAEEPIQI